jgi:DNA invertase Pin-like site-specific DNA recombinase
LNDRALRARAAAARELIRNREVSPEVGLSYAVWPTVELEEASAGDPRRFTSEDHARALQLVAAGVSWSQAAREIGCNKATVGDWVRRATIASDVQVSAGAP